MRALDVLGAELSKALTLPATWVGVGVAAAGSIALTLLNASMIAADLRAGRFDQFVSASPTEAAFAAMPLGTVGAVVLGVVIMSSEYAPSNAEVGGGRQIGATLTAMPGRAGVLAAKAAVLAALVTAVAAVTLPATVGIARIIIGAGHESVGLAETVTRGAGGALYWVLTGLLALAITTLTRSGVLPLIVLVLNSSIVSLSLLLTHLTPLAHWLPDLAGRRLFGEIDTIEGGLEALPGAVVMAAWTLGLLAIAAASFRGRDA
ncbi:ABC-type transport system involved in multi-copper enzyme maturation permease subunit [Kineosphaera limosa]|uniref:ABC transporter permease protein n=1 Tax=Kineosphaera limosa NBRC 100340 TaxID=1184609 RepID=K6X7M0_9MICO|nr:hypothetical protein [Kineosphaera limosa]NYD98891.1 ABC-type transport system involved in multi-copper enzyme maturation permease subunit [Kineosphaera limosa]GAB94784.1 hypothetical protein KILIM_011_00570 [Kineosphaera limosa NBRC 100340]